MTLLLCLFLAIDYELAALPNQQACDARIGRLSVAADKLVVRAYFLPTPQRRSDAIRLVKAFEAERDLWAELKEAQRLRELTIDRGLCEEGIVKLVVITLRLVDSFNWFRDRMEKML